MSRTVQAFTLALIAVLSGACGLAAEPIRLGQVNLSFYAVTGGVVQEILERSGQDFSVIEGSHGEIYPKLGTGEIDILAASWLPNAHGGLFEQVRDKSFMLAKLYDEARLYMAVPDYAPARLKRIGDLALPEFASTVDRKIVGIGPTSGLMIGAAKMMDAYGLKNAGYELVPGPAADWVANFKKAYEDKRVVVMPLWQPQWLNAVYKVRVLEDPQKIFGDGDSAYLVASTSLKDKLPLEVLGRLQSMKLSIAAVTEMDRLMNVEKMSPRDAARKWIADNPEATKGWFP
jgi:glycine betaine/proline transport system substrate-binding protein